jgi:SAM-dependent methyltransferase
MLLTITSTTSPATDLGFLLHKNPARAQSFPLGFGQAHVFYPEASADRCTIALLLDIDPVGLVRGKGPSGAGNSRDGGEYVSDRPYVASSFLAVAIGEVFGTALAGRSRERAELAATPLPLEAMLSVVPARGGEATLRKLFEPLGYEVQAEPLPLDEQFPEWGVSRYLRVDLRGRVRVRDLLAHLAVLIPVLDDRKHYFVGDDEVEKLLRRGEGWLSAHPSRQLIAGRYLKHRRSLVRDALDRLESDDADPEEQDDPLGLAGIDGAGGSGELAVTSAGLTPFRNLEMSATAEGGAAGALAANQRWPSLHELRLQAVVAQLKAAGATSVLDLGCGEGRLLRELLADRSFERIVGLDVSFRSLERARGRLRLDRLPPRQAERITLLHGALTYRDRRWNGFDAAAVVEVIEHLDPPRLAAFERALFHYARPATIVMTTPNIEHNVRYASLPEGTLRHADHRFEWTRAEFAAWAGGVAERHGYCITISGIGTDDPEVGAPSQLAVFRRETAP